MDCRVKDLLDLNKTISSSLFDDVEYPWEVLPNIKEFILKLGPTLNEQEYDHPQDDVWIAKSASVFSSAYISGPLIICEDAEIRHGAFIRGCAVVGKGAVVGNSVELKNCILFDGAQAPHFNYVGDSILGYKSHIGAGGITSNLKSDKTNITVKSKDGKKIETGLRKFGAILGDNVEVGCNSVLNPGTIIGRNSMVYPTTGVRGFVPECSIVKKSDLIIKKS